MHAKHQPVVCHQPEHGGGRWQAPPPPGGSTEGRAGGDPHSLCWEGRGSPGARGSPHQRAQGVMNFSSSWGIRPVGPEERKAEREQPPETKDAPLTYILCTPHPRGLGSCLLSWLDVHIKQQHTPPWLKLLSPSVQIRPLPYSAPPQLAIMLIDFL